jgi:hypothetical protein
MTAISPAAQTADVIMSMLRFIDSTPSRATANAIKSNVKQLCYEKVFRERDSITLCEPVSTLRQCIKTRVGKSVEDSAVGSSLRSIESFLIQTECIIEYVFQSAFPLERANEC